MAIRGENVTICATVDLDREDTPKGLKLLPLDEVRRLIDAQKSEKKRSDDRKAKALRRAGVEPNTGLAQGW
jgi:U6 snRNA-associated Sm-like protein LSm1